MQVATIGLDLAKQVFQIHGSDAAEKVVSYRRILVTGGIRRQRFELAI
jgi:hypothetical protein